MASSIPIRTVLVVVLAITLVGGAVAFGGVVALDLQQDADEQNAGNESDRQQTAVFRVVHASPDAPAVNVTVDDETVFSGVEFGTVSDYLTREAGTHDVTITATDSDAVVFDEEIAFEPRSVTTVVASGEIGEGAQTTFEPIAFADDGVTPAEDESALRVLHLSPDAPAVDVTTGNESVVLAENVSFRNASDYVTVPAGNYTAEIRAATAENDGSILGTVNVSLEGGTAYSAFAVGYLNPDETSADTPFESLLTADATRTVELPGDRATDDEGEGEDDEEESEDGDTDADEGAEADDETESDDESAADAGDETDGDDAEDGDDDGSGDADDSNGEVGDSDGEPTDESDPGTEGDDDGADEEGEDDATGDDDSSDGEDGTDDGEEGTDDGDDGTDDTASQGGPETIGECRTIDEPGTYEITEDVGGTNVQSIDLGNGLVRQTCLSIQSSDVVLDGGGFAVSGSGLDLSVGVHVYDPADSAVQNVTVRDLQVEGWSNGVQVGVDTWAVPSPTPATASIENVQSIGNGHHGFFVVSGGTELSSVVANDNGASGIGVFDSGSLQVTGATTTGNAEHGVALLEEVFGSTVSDVSTTGNGGAEIYVGSVSSGNAFTDITFGAEDDSVEGFEESDNTIDDPPGDTNETDEESDGETDGENGNVTGNQTDADDGADAGNETETDDGADDAGNATDADADADDEADDGNQSDTDDGADDAGNETEVDDGADDEADAGNQTDADDEADGAGNETEVDADDEADAGNETDADDGADEEADGGNQTDADDEADDAGNVTDGGAGADGVNESS